MIFHTKQYLLQLVHKTFVFTGKTVYIDDVFITWKTQWQRTQLQTNPFLGY